MQWVQTQANICISLSEMEFYNIQCFLKKVQPQWVVQQSIVINKSLYFSNFESIKTLFCLDLSWHTYVVWSYKLRHKSFTFTFTQSSLIFYYGPCQMTKPEIISQMISGIPIKICLWTLSYWQYTFSRVSWKCHQNPLWKAHSEFYLIISGSLGLKWYLEFHQDNFHNFFIFKLYDFQCKVKISSTSGDNFWF